jgi:hypothetical protein
MPVTYTVKDDSGHVHTRTSAGDNEPRYTHAVVRVPGGGKADVSYCSRLDLAQGILAQAMRPLEGNNFTRKHYPERIGKPPYPEAKIYPVQAEVKLRQKRRPA